MDASFLGKAPGCKNQTETQDASFLGKEPGCKNVKVKCLLKFTWGFTRFLLTRASKILTKKGVEGSNADYGWQVHVGALPNPKCIILVVVQGWKMKILFYFVVQVHCSLGMKNNKLKEWIRPIIWRLCIWFKIKMYW